VDVLAFLRAEAEVLRPVSSCELCGSLLVWVTDWPTVGDSRWLCPTCAAWPVRALADVWACLTATERSRLHVEAARGDTLARLVMTLANQPSLMRCPRCGDNRWRAAPEVDRVTCVGCGALACSGGPGEEH
jgi:hypothetical protein